ncbi:MAG: Cna B-type domain-containing protein, partial [Clostridia bacterium]|nr:Cna B-type domain-containing protein [Clostridia bacterium]
MPLNGDEFYYVTQSGQYTMELHYRTEVLSGQTGAYPYSGKQYNQHHIDSFKSSGNGWFTTVEDHYAITGFTYTNNLDDGSSFTRVGNTNTYRVIFYYNRNSYDIKFINNAVVEQTVTKQYQADISGVSYTPTTPPPGYPAGSEFGGWYDNELGQGLPFVFSGTMPAHGITVYAKWNKPIVKVYAYLDQAGTDLATGWGPKEQAYGSTVDGESLPTPTTPPGSTFVGWTTRSGSPGSYTYSPFNFATILDGEVRLYPYFVDGTSYSVTYDGNGATTGTVSDPLSYASGSYADVKPGTGLTKTGMVFIGWNTKEEGDGTDYYPNDKVEITKNVKLYAKWGPVPGKTSLTYYRNHTDPGALPPDSYTDGNIQNNATITLRPADTFSRAGYEFTGWNTEADGSGTTFAAGASVVVSTEEEPNELYALWARIKIDVTGTKVWENGPAERPDVWFKLYREIENGAAEVVPDTGLLQIPDVSPFTVTWTGIDETDTNGIPYIFTVQEVDANGADYTPTAYEKVESGLTVTNTYTATGSFDIDLTLNPTKELAGRALKVNEFEFELTQVGSAEVFIQTVKNEQNGNIPFSALNYTQADIGKSFEYVIRELVPASPETGMSYDTMVLAFTVVVSDLGSGKLSAVLETTPEDTVFNNSYTATGSFDIDLTLNPTKELAGRALKVNEFEFELTQVGPAEVFIQT